MFSFSFVTSPPLVMMVSFSQLPRVVFGSRSVGLLWPNLGCHVDPRCVCVALDAIGEKTECAGWSGSIGFQGTQGRDSELSGYGRKETLGRRS